MNNGKGKLTTRDVATARALTFAPWISLLLLPLPITVVFLVLFFSTSAPDAAAFYLVLAAISLGVGFAAGLLIALMILVYRSRWLARLRDKLAADGITADELIWFKTELTSVERKALKEMERTNPLLADAYRETLASRVTASRIISRARRELLKVERRMGRALTLSPADVSSLTADLESDHQQLQSIRDRATEQLSKTRARLQMIEATASRNLSQIETDQMLRRLTAAQEQVPLALQMIEMEQQAMRDAEHDIDRETDRNKLPS
ncbi:MAG: hypothetical protein ABR555_15585 [Pyrinomonadaceae bacterium]